MSNMSNRIALCDISGPLTDLLQKLSGENGDKWQQGLTKFLRKENPWENVAAPELNVWKTIKLGTGLKTADDFSRALKENGCKIGNWAKDIFNKPEFPEFTVAPQETEVDLVVVSVAELGFKEGTTRQNICKRAHELGLALCLAEVGPQLRLQYQDQPKNEWILVAMDPITDSGGLPGVFCVGRDGKGLWLRSLDGYPNCYWGAGYRWCFSAPQAVSWT